MKVFCLYAILGFAAVVAQTTILRLPLWHGMFYDLLIPVVIFLGLHHRNGTGVLLFVGLGMIMDLLSGGVFGVYLTTYFWIFLSVKHVSRYFDVDDSRLQSILVVACVLGQQVLFWASTAAMSKGPPFSAAQAGSVVLQVIMAALTGPGILLVLEKLQTRFEWGLPRPQRKRGDFATR